MWVRELLDIMEAGAVFPTTNIPFTDGIIPFTDELVIALFEILFSWFPMSSKTSVLRCT